MPAYTFSRPSTKLHNTTISGPDNMLLYEITTPRNRTGILLKAPPTTVWRYVRAGGQNQRIQVAVLEWCDLSGDFVTFGNAPQSVPMKTFLVKPNFLSRSRDMATPIGVFRWKEISEKPELFNASQHSVVHWHRNRRHLLMADKAPTAGENPYLLVDPIVQPVMDHVIVGFLIMHQIIAQRTRKAEGEDYSSGESADGGT